MKRCFCSSARLTAAIVQALLDHLEGLSTEQKKAIFPVRFKNFRADGYFQWLHEKMASSDSSVTYSKVITSLLTNSFRL